MHEFDRYQLALQKFIAAAAHFDYAEQTGRDTHGETLQLKSWAREVAALARKLTGQNLEQFEDSVRVQQLSIGEQIKLLKQKAAENFAKAKEGR